MHISSTPLKHNGSNFLPFYQNNKKVFLPRDFFEACVLIVLKGTGQVITSVRPKECFALTSRDVIIA